MVHLYRGEMQRANTWRTRLDSTTNWAVVTTGAALPFVFGGANIPHFVVLLVIFLVLTFLYIEARRYRYYVLWAYRSHLMETDFFAAMLTPPFSPSPDWADLLTSSLRDPTLPIPKWEAIGRRFRRNYIWLVSLLIISWCIKLAIHPVPVRSWEAFLRHAAVGPVHGWVTIGIVIAIYVGLGLLAIAASVYHPLRETVVEGREREEGRFKWPLLPEPRKGEQLATIITGKGKAVAAQLLSELGRGVTALKGTGMYTTQNKDVLLCAVTDAQTMHLREIVHEVDSDAFLIVTPAAEVRGGQFRPFQPPS